MDYLPYKRTNHGITVTHVLYGCLCSVDWTVKCGPGWESNPVTSFCYIFIDEPLSWFDALNQCQQYHGNLVAIETLQEQNYLAGKHLCIFL